MRRFLRGKKKPLIPSIEPCELIDPSIPISLRFYTFVDGSLTPNERIILSALAKSACPEVSFEIGTFDGRTTWNIAANSPEDGIVYTLDLPKDRVEDTELSIDELDRPCIEKEECGLQFKGPEFASKIQQLFGDSATFDFSPYYGSSDFVFIDGSHSYDYVKSDSEVALKLRKGDDSILLWHDYDRPDQWPGLMQGMDELYRSGGVYSRLRHIRGTSFVVLPSG